MIDMGIKGGVGFPEAIFIFVSASFARHTRGSFFCARSSKDRATDFGSVGWGFESLRAHHLSIAYLPHHERPIH